MLNSETMYSSTTLPDNLGTMVSLRLSDLRHWVKFHIRFSAARDLFEYWSMRLTTDGFEMKSHIHARMQLTLWPGTFNKSLKGRFIFSASGEVPVSHCGSMRGKLESRRIYEDANCSSVYRFCDRVQVCAQLCKASACESTLMERPRDIRL